MEETKPYKIAINTRALMTNKLDGIGWFTYQILKRWVQNNPQHKFYFLFDRPYDESFIFGENVEPIVVYPPARHPLLWYIWYEWAVPRVLNKIKPDAFVSLDTYTSIRWKGTKITAIHDIAFALFDGHVYPLTQKFLRYFTPKYIKTSNTIVTVSEATKRDLVTRYHCDESKILVTHNAPSDSYQPLKEEDIKQFKAENTKGSDFFLYVGSIHPRKNVLNLLKSFEKFKTDIPTDKKLVLIGRLAWKYDGILAFHYKMMHKNDVIFIPHSPPDKISKWMASSIALVMVSIYEGFGVPIVEAMASGVPVICSNVSSMPEVASDAAIKVSPENVDEISKAMKNISSDNAVRNQLIENGKVQVKKYDWDTAAKSIWNELERLIQKV